MSVVAVPPARFVAALTAAHTIDLAAYTLPPGAVRAALAGAARHGARVTIHLEGHPPCDPHGGLRAYNAALAADLRAAGATVVLTSPADPVLHLKAAVTDGVAWLDDRNWTGGGGATLLRDADPADVAVVRAALAGVPAHDRHLATSKREAQALELAAIAAAGTAPLAVATESFGPGEVAAALLARARAGRPTRLLVAGREAHAAAGARERSLLRRLAAAGVRVRVGRDAEKLAVGGPAAWVGSANATYSGGAYGTQRDWGLLTRERPLIDTLRAAFSRAWAGARPLRP
jgi:hypothetical protein